MNSNLKYDYVKPTIKYINLNKNKKNQKLKLIFKIISIVFIIYILMLLPLLFIYPNFNKPVRFFYDKQWFSEIAKNLKGDCFRKAQDFKRRCPFPAREVHLNGVHTILEIKINNKWIAYDPSYDTFFENYNVTQISFDVKRNYIMNSMSEYPYKYSFSHFHFYHNLYFLMLNYTHPYYDRILRMFYGIAN